MSKVKEVNIVFLVVSSFVGIGVGAKHYYGKLEALIGGEPADVTAPLTAAQARAFNKEWGMLKLSFGYQEGEESSRISSRAKVISLAKKQFKKHFPKATVLILGRPAVCAPFEVLIGPKEFKEKMTKLAKRYDKLNWDRAADREEIEEILHGWQELWPIKYTSFGS